MKKTKEKTLHRRQESIPYLTRNKLIKREEKQKEWEKAHLQASIQQLRLSFPLFPSGLIANTRVNRPGKKKEDFFCPALN